VRVPGYLDREELITRVAENRFDVSQNDRWIEPLEENISRVLAQNLYALLRSERIVRYPWPTSRRITHQVEVEILRFEPNSAREAELAARDHERVEAGSVEVGRHRLRDDVVVLDDQHPRHRGLR